MLHSLIFEYESEWRSMAFALFYRWNSVATHHEVKYRQANFTPDRFLHPCVPPANVVMRRHTRIFIAAALIGWVGCSLFFGNSAAAVAGESLSGGG